MDCFCEDSNVQVIFVFIMVGGFGLNFIVGNSVYVMELQYNFVVEVQVIDCVYRFGQEWFVCMVCYIMWDSFEEKMIEFQDKKKKLVNLSMDVKVLDKIEVVKQKLMDF